MSSEDVEKARAQVQPQTFAGASLVFSVLGGLACVVAGIYLASVDAVDSSSLGQVLANGIGWYCIGRGLFMMATPFQLRGAVNHLRRSH